MDSGHVNVSMAPYTYELGFTAITHAAIWEVPHVPVLTRRLIDIITTEPVFIVMVHLVNSSCPH